MKVTIYHNPSCTKSRQALALLRERGVEPEIVEYLKTPPDAATLRTLLRKLGLKPRDLLRRKEQEFRAAGLDDPAVTDAGVVRAMTEYPRLIERPIVVKGARAVIGRPPENVLEIL